MMSVSRFVAILCILIPWAIVTECDHYNAENGCQTELTSVRMEVSPVMLYAICRDNNTASLVVSCDENVWYKEAQGFCNSFDLNIGTVFMHRSLISSTLTLQLVKAGRILDAARVVIITSEHLLQYRISVWGHQDTRFVLTITRTCPTSHEHAFGETHSNSHPWIHSNSKDHIPLISSFDQSVDSMPESEARHRKPQGKFVHDSNIPEYLRPNRLNKLSSKTENPLVPDRIHQHEHSPRGGHLGIRKPANLHIHKTKMSSRLADSNLKDSAVSEHLRFAHLLKHQKRVTTTQASSEVAKLQWMEDKRLLFEEKMKFLRNYYPQTATSKYESITTSSPQHRNTFENAQTSSATFPSPQPFVGRLKTMQRNTKQRKFRRRLRNSGNRANTVTVRPFTSTFLDPDQTVPPPTAAKLLMAADTENIEVRKIEDNSTNLSIVDPGFANPGSFKVTPSSPTTTEEPVAESLANSALNAPSPSPGGLPLFLPLQTRFPTAAGPRITLTTLPGHTSVSSMRVLPTVSMKLQSSEQIDTDLTTSSSISADKMTQQENAAAAITGSVTTGWEVVAVMSTQSSLSPTSASIVLESSHVSISSSKVLPVPVELEATPTVLTLSSEQRMPVQTSDEPGGHATSSWIVDKPNTEYPDTTTLVPSMSSRYLLEEQNTRGPAPLNTLDFESETTTSSLVTSFQDNKVTRISLESSMSVIQNTISHTSHTSSISPTSTVANVKPRNDQLNNGIVLEDSESSETETMTPSKKRPLKTTTTAEMLVMATSAPETKRIRPSQPSELLMTSEIPFGTVTPQPEKDPEGIDEDSFWPVVAGLVIGIPAVIVIGIAITVIHKRSTPDPAKFFNMQALKSSPHASMDSSYSGPEIAHQSSVDV